MKLRFALMTLLLSVLVLSACGAQGAPVPADPVEAVKAIADKQAEIKTQHLDLIAGPRAETRRPLVDDDPTRWPCSRTSRPT